LEKLTSILAVVDRAEAGGTIIDKAMFVARRFGARVELLLGDPVHERAFASLCSKRGFHEVTLQNVDLATETVHEIILDRVRANRPDLVIKAPAGVHPMQRWAFDDNDWRLANECPVPVLLVRNRPWLDSPRFAAAVDVANEEHAHIARGILQAAGFMGLGCHAKLDVLYGEREQHDESLRMQRAVKLAQLVREFHVGCECLHVIPGAPEKVLPPLATARQYDVLVLGAQTTRPGFKTLFGSVTSRLVDATQGDVLLVRAPTRGTLCAADRDASAREQRLHEAEQFV
jgi:nucleotide-binding universal stress UspA family protein